VRIKKTTSAVGLHCISCPVASVHCHRKPVDCVTTGKRFFLHRAPMRDDSSSIETPLSADQVPIECRLRPDCRQNCSGTLSAPIFNTTSCCTVGPQWNAGTGRVAAQQAFNGALERGRIGAVPVRASPPSSSTLPLFAPAVLTGDAIHCMTVVVAYRGRIRRRMPVAQRVAWRSCGHCRPACRSTCPPAASSGSC
jgi:hypothetical protein